MDKMQNFVVGDIVTAPSPASSGTTIEVESKENFPNPSTFGEYNLVLWNKEGIPDTSNCEIVRVTSISVVNSTLTELNITRAQEGTTAKTITTSWRAYLSPTKKYFDDLKTYIDGLQLTKATGSDINTGTNDSKFITPKAIADSWIETGWIPARETWEYASVDNPTGVFTISGDVTSKYSTGMRLKMTNGGNTIYGIITAVSYSSPNTSITFLHEINPSNSQALNLMANSAITNPFYSTQKTPSGFPASQSKWTYTLINNAVHNTKASVTASEWHNASGSGLSGSVPIGEWFINYRLVVDGIQQTSASSPSSTPPFINISLSTSNNSESNSLFTLGVGNVTVADLPAQGYKGVNNLGVNSRINNPLTITAKTTYYLIHQIQNSGTLTRAGFRGDLVPTLVTLTCAYL